jgi:hypothetical protein
MPIVATAHFSRQLKRFCIWTAVNLCNKSPVIIAFQISPKGAFHDCTDRLPSYFIAGHVDIHFPFRLQSRFSH